VRFESRFDKYAGQDHRGFDLISDVLPYGRLWYAEPNAVGNATDYAKFYSRSHEAASRACAWNCRTVLPRSLYRTAVSHVMKSSSVRRVLSVTNSMMFASSTNPINGVSSGIKSDGSTK